MTHDQLSELMSLPIADRVTIAQALWQSIHGEEAASRVQDALVQAQSRDAELHSGVATGKSHQEVMDAVRRALSCG